MKYATITLLLATLALANPAPIADPEAIAQPAPIAQPELEALAARVAALEVELDARKSGVQLESRDPKGSKTGSTGSKNKTSAAGTLTPSLRTLELGALSLGVMEVVRLWG